jgi:hypothetical protein
VIERYRVGEKDWTRQRGLTFEKVAVLILQGHRCSLRTNLNRCYQAMGNLKGPSWSQHELIKMRQRVEGRLVVRA